MESQPHRTEGRHCLPPDGTPPSSTALIARDIPDRLMMNYLLIFGTLFLTVAGQLVLKWRALALRPGPPASGVSYLVTIFTDPYVWLGLGGAVLASVCWVLAVRQTPLSVAYPFMALSFLLVPAAASVLFGESISAGQYAGMATIVAGVALTAILR
jgi:multidrug transporter EmrE-like cation transporter